MASQSGGSNLPVAGIVAVIVAAIGAALFTRVPLEVPRPPVNSGLRYQEPALQDLDARLWEDPFASVYRARKEAGGTLPADSKHTLNGVCDHLRKLGPGTKVLPNREARLLVLGVMVSNAPYSDGEEQRRRVRYAVQAAMNVSQFTPENAQHVGYFRFGADAEQLLVPFELFKRKNSTEMHNDYRVMVLWLEDEWFQQDLGSGPTPLTRTQSLAQGLTARCSAAARSAAEQPLVVSLSVLGPATSDTLRAMRQEAGLVEKTLGRPARSLTAAQRQILWPGLRNVSFYSPFATAAEKDLLQRDECDRRDRTPQPPPPAGTTPRECSLHALFKAQDIRFLRTTTTDLDLARTLAAELHQRGVWPGAKHGHFVALVSELDTYYGRMLPKAFQRVIGSERDCEIDPSESYGAVEGAPPSAGCRVLRFGYFRGLDGQVPADASAAKGTTPAPDLVKSLTTRPQLERAEGPKQFDYMRRLADRIKRDNLRLRELAPAVHAHPPDGYFRDECDEELCAIGVLGSDVYDKIAVLRALRREFPRAVFFTTDLDVRMLDGEQYEWTRNLVVVSSFGLELSPCLQKSVPPFRSSYQTAAYLSTHLALHDLLVDEQGKANGALLDHRNLVCPESGPSAQRVYLPNLSPEVDKTTDGRCTSGPRRGDRGNQPVFEDEADVQCKLTRWLAPPRNFELGRTQAFDLSQPDPECTERVSCLSPHGYATSHILTEQQTSSGLIVLAVVAAALLAFRKVRRLLAFCGRFVRGSLRSNAPRGERIAALAFSVFSVVLLGSLVVLNVRAWHASQATPGTRLELLAKGNLIDAGEPFAWFEGLSVWPAEWLRVLAVIVALIFLAASFRSLRENEAMLKSAFDIEDAPPQASWWRRLFGVLDGVREADRSIDVARLWREYTDAGAWYVSLFRAVIPALAFVILAGLLIAVFGIPHEPVRGLSMARLNLVLTVAALVAFLLTLFYANDLTRLCQRFIERLSWRGWLTDWPEPVMEKYAAQLGLQQIEDKALRRRLLAPWIDIQLVAKRTAPVGEIIYAPFALLALVLISRWPAFADWDMPVGLVIVYGGAFVIACASAYLLQRSAARARNAAVEQLRGVLMERQGNPAGGVPAPNHIQAIIDRIQGLREGAFLPIMEQPAVQAALLPFGSVGLLQLFQVFGLGS
jgi:hypothetical protein